MSGSNNVQNTFTIFGGTGDLTFRKLLPAFYNLFVDQKWPCDLQIIIIGRRPYTNEAYRKEASTWVKQFARFPYRANDFEAFAQKIQYVTMDFHDLKMYDKLNEFYQEHDLYQHIFYLAVAPQSFKTIVEGLTRVKHANKGKVIIEKPFGEDLPSAKKLNKDLEAFFTQDHIFHIDHYLGKEMIRNIQTIRFANPLFKHMWSNEFIEHIQISALESIGVENRGNYYDGAGALKDMVQNHLFQILTILAMEEPADYDQEMHTKQYEVLQALRPVAQLDMEDSMVLGQYFDYQKETHVADDSMTETYAALRLFVDTKRWSGVPFYIRTGKKLNRRETEIAITFKRANPTVESNVLMIKIQPTEGVYFQFNIKEPGNSNKIILAQMDFCQSCLDVYRMNTPEAYERLLLAAIDGDSSWFSKWDHIEASWKYVEELKEIFEKGQMTTYVYPSGSDGPKAAKDLLSKHGHTWFLEPDHKV